MINKFEVGTTIEIRSMTDMENRSLFMRDIDPTLTKLEEVIATYDIQNEDIRCGLKNCRQPHHIGYLVRTANNSETNIGRICGRTHFGAEFGQLKNKYNNESRLHQYRKLLNEIVYNHEAILERVKWLRESGGDWLYRAVKLFRDTYPKAVVTEIQNRARRNENIVYVERERTSAELVIAKAASDTPGREASKEPERYVREAIGSLKGLRVFSRSIRDVLILEIEGKVKSLLEIDPNTSVTKLKEWNDWANGLDDLFTEAEELICLGRAFFNRENIALVHEYVAIGEDRDKTRCIKLDFSNI